MTGQKLVGVTDRLLADGELLGIHFRSQKRGSGRRCNRSSTGLHKLCFMPVHWAMRAITCITGRALHQSLGPWAPSLTLQGESSASGQPVFRQCRAHGSNFFNSLQVPLHLQGVMLLVCGVGAENTLPYLE